MTETIKAAAALVFALSAITLLMVAIAQPSERPEAFYQQTANTVLQ